MMNTQPLLEMGPTTKLPANSPWNKTNPEPPRDAEREHLPHRKISTFWVVAGVLVIALILTALFVTSLLPRLRQDTKLKASANAAVQDAPSVTVTTAKLAPDVSQQVLPGNSQAYREAALYARTTGYIKQWFKDIGDRVDQGDLIAEIAAPDLDDQLAQAQANLEQARATLKLNQANAGLAGTTMARYLATQRQDSGAIAKLLIDEQRATVLTSKASVVAAEASIGVNEAMVRMYSDLQSFEKIVAPFSGIVTARNVDPGALVTADNPSATRELFHVMQTNPLRVFVDAPQTVSTGIEIGESADVYRPEQPDKVFHGKVTRTASALDPNTRTLLVQVDVPNPDAALRPGMYLTVKFSANRDGRVVLIPSAALVMRSDGRQEVAALNSNNAVSYKKVQLGRDFGREVEINSGLQGGETIIVHPGDALAEGQEVKPIKQKTD
jgi:RND family efflux transporter MFP subunit